LIQQLSCLEAVIYKIMLTF